MKKKNTFLFLIDRTYNLSSLLSLVERLLIKNKIVLFISVPINADTLKRFKDLDAEIILMTKVLPSNNANESVNSNKKISPKALLFSLSFSQIVLSFVHYYRLKKMYKKVTRLLKDYEIDFIFLNSDRGEISYEQVLIRYALDNNIPTMVPYFSYISDGVSIREGRHAYNMSFPLSFLKLIMALFYKEELFKNGKETLFFYQIEKWLALKYFGTCSTYPWSIGNGPVDYVCVDTPDTKEFVTNYKVLDEKVQVTGDLSYDKIFQSHKNKSSLRQKLNQQFSLDADKPLLILALPQYFEHKLLPWEEHIQEITWLLETIKTLPVEIVISLHPKANKENYSQVISENRGHILDQSLNQIIGAGDLFLATNSSTVFWATLCGLPSVVMNYHNLVVSPFNDFEGIAISEDKMDLISKLEHFLINKVDFAKDWKRLNRDNIFDGQSLDKYEALINRRIADTKH